MYAMKLKHVAVKGFPRTTVRMEMVAANGATTTSPPRTATQAPPWTTEQQQLGDATRATATGAAAVTNGSSSSPARLAERKGEPSPPTATQVGREGGACPASD